MSIATNWQLEESSYHTSIKDSVSDTHNPFEYQKASRVQRSAKRKQVNTQQKNPSKKRGYNPHFQTLDDWY